VVAFACVCRGDAYRAYASPRMTKRRAFER